MARPRNIADLRGDRPRYPADCCAGGDGEPSLPTRHAGHYRTRARGCAGRSRTPRPSFQMMEQRSIIASPALTRGRGGAPRC